MTGNIDSTNAARYEAVVIGASSGGVKALSSIISCLGDTFPFPVMVVLHIHPHADAGLVRLLDTRYPIHVKEADEKEPAHAGVVYFAPPNYHLLVEEERTLSLSVEERVNHSRPSIDLLFETAAEAYGTGLIGIVLTGANHDGAQGLKRIVECGGMAVVQNPATAEAMAMPEAALKVTPVDHVLPLEEIGPWLVSISGEAASSRVGGQREASGKGDDER
jgi:two-component system chemotaxis response regulator CheB